jgi:hypothetical protein
MTAKKTRIGCTDLYVPATAPEIYRNGGNGKLSASYTGLHPSAPFMSVK